MEVENTKTNKRKVASFRLEPTRLFIHNDWNKFVEMLEKEDKATKANKIVTYVAVIQEFTIS